MQQPAHTDKLVADFILTGASRLVTLVSGAHPAADGALGVIEHGALAARAEIGRAHV